MAGLLKQPPQGGAPPSGMPQAQGGPPMAGATGQPMPAGPGAGPPTEEAGNVSPEEQAEYEQFVTNGMQLMYNEELMPQLLERIEGAGNPVEGLANAAAMVVMRLEDSAEGQERAISEDVKFHGGTELLEQMAELAQEAGIHEYSEEEVESAFYLALDIYRSTRQEQGKLSMDEINQEMQSLVQADQAGRLNEVLPGIEQAAAHLAETQPTSAPPPGGDRMRQRG